jgi:predicted nucleic acid-binding protein
MSKRSVYDTRFFVEYYYTQNADFLKRLKSDLRKTKERLISSITIHETYRLILEKEGRDVAKWRCEIMSRDFKVVNVDTKIAIESANIRYEHRIPMADSIIAATALVFKAPIVSDDPHFAGVKEVSTRWFR